MEVLVALIVAGLFLSVLGRAMSQAWSASKAPLDMVSAVVLAREAAFGAPASSFRDAVALGYRIDRTSAEVAVVERPSGLAPAPRDAPPESQDGGRTKTTPAGMLLAEPKGIVQAAADAPHPALRRILVTVQTPTGRRLRFETVRLESAGP